MIAQLPHANSFKESYWATQKWSNTWGNAGTFKTAGVQPGSDKPIAATPTRIKAWSSFTADGAPFLARFDFYYSDGTTEFMGISSTNDLKLAADKTLSLGETIVRANQWTNRHSGAYLNVGYWLHTSEGRTLDFLPKNNTAIRWDPRVMDNDDLDVGSGILLGGVSTANQASYMSLLFLGEVANTSLINVNYTTKPDSNTIKQHVYLEIPIENKLDTNGTMTVNESDTRTTTRNWSVAVTAGTTIKTSVSASVYGIASVSGSISFSLSSEIKSGSSESVDETIAWKATSVTPAKSVTTATLSYSSGSVDVQYKGTLQVKLSNGYDYEAPCQGRYTQDAVGISQISFASKSLNS